MARCHAERPCRPAVRTSVFQTEERGCNSLRGYQVSSSLARTHRSSCRVHRRGSYPRTRGFDSLSCDDRFAIIRPLAGRRGMVTSGPPRWKDCSARAASGFESSGYTSSALRSASGEATIASSKPALDPFVARTNAGFDSLHCDRRWSNVWTESWQWRQAGLLVRTARKGRVRFLLRPQMTRHGW
jgi:hypothetical protein